MSDKKMTETEIMKDLKYAAEWFSEHGRNTNKAIVGICERAIDIINGKNAEIDRLIAVEEEHRKQNGELRKEVDRLEQNLKEAHIDIKEHIAKIEALQEYYEECQIAKEMGGGVVREKLIELLIKTFDEQYEKRGFLIPQFTADFLIENGVTIKDHTAAAVKNERR